MSAIYYTAASLDGFIADRNNSLAWLNAIGVVAHGGRQDYPPLLVGQRLGKTAAQSSDQGIGGTQVDPDSQATLVRLWTLAGFGDLQ